MIITTLEIYVFICWIHVATIPRRSHSTWIICCMMAAFVAKGATRSQRIKRKKENKSAQSEGYLTRNSFFHAPFRNRQNGSPGWHALPDSACSSASHGSSGSPGSKLDLNRITGMTRSIFLFHSLLIRITKGGLTMNLCVPKRGRRPSHKFSIIVCDSYCYSAIGYRASG